MNPKENNVNIIVEMRSGSYVYGTNTSESDDDFRGVFLPDPKIVYSVFKNIEQIEETKDKDRILYTLKKFLRLSADCNPNIIEQWFTPSSFYIKSSPLWEKLLEYRHLFISKKAKHTFSGYAVSQLKKLKNHHKWVKDPPKKPELSDYGLDKQPEVGKSQTKAILSLPTNFVKDEYREFAENFHKYQNALKDYNDYYTHLNQRNPARLALELKYGFDCKHAYHLIRLYHEAVEILKTGKITLPRPEKDLLLEIRNGQHSLERIIEMGDTFEKQLDQIYDESPLQHKPQLNKIDELFYDIILEYCFKK